MSSFESRLARALKLEPALYTEVEEDKTSVRQAALVVAVSSLSAGVAMSEEGISTLWVLAANVAASFIGWVIWAWVIYIVGTKFFPEPQTKTRFSELLRVLGFAAAPGIIRFAGIFPGLAFPVFLIASLWSIAATVIAIRAALDYRQTGRALAVCLSGWLVQTLFIWCSIILLSWILSPVIA